MQFNNIEYILAKLYTDPTFRQSFLDNPSIALAPYSLTPAEMDSFLKIDKAGLVMASRSYYHKRQKKLSGITFKNWLKEIF